MALIATPFFLLLFGIVELGMIFLVASSLENATAEAARTIRTGEMQTAGGATASTFKTRHLQQLRLAAGGLHCEPLGGRAHLLDLRLGDRAPASGQQRVRPPPS